MLKELDGEIRGQYVNREDCRGDILDENSDRTGQDRTRQDNMG